MVTKEILRDVSVDRQVDLKLELKLAAWTWSAEELCKLSLLDRCIRSGTLNHAMEVYYSTTILTPN